MLEIAKKTFSRGNTFQQNKSSSKEIAKVSSKQLDTVQTKNSQNKYKLSINNAEVSEFMQNIQLKDKNQSGKNIGYIRTTTMCNKTRASETSKRGNAITSIMETNEDKFSFNIDDYRRKSDNTKSSGKLRQIFEEKKSVCDYGRGSKRRNTNIKIAKMRCFYFLEKMVENSISYLERFKILEDSESFAERVIIELTKVNKNPEIIGQLLEKLPGFKRFMCIMGIQRKTLFQAADKLCWQNLKPEEYVFKEHDISDNFYCILTGKIELSKTKFIDKDLENLNQSQPKPSMAQFTRKLTVKANTNKLVKYEEPFTTLKEGEIFGEYGLIDNKNRQANAKAITEANLLVVNKSCFKQYFKSSIEKVLIERKLFLLAHFPLFSSFNKDEFQNLFLKMVIRPYNKGKAIVSEGSKADRIYMILKGGTCKLKKFYKSEEIHLLTLMEGDIFGLESSSKKNYNEIMDNKKTKIENPKAEPNYKLDQYNYSVYSNSDNTILIELNLITSDIYKADFFEFLYSLHLKKSVIIEHIYEKNIKQRIKFKPKYKIDVLNQKVGKNQAVAKPVIVRELKPLVIESKNEFKKFYIDKTPTSYNSNFNISLDPYQTNYRECMTDPNQEKLKNSSNISVNRPIQTQSNFSFSNMCNQAPVFSLKHGSLLKVKNSVKLFKAKIESSISNLKKKNMSLSLRKKGYSEYEENSVFIDKPIYDILRNFNSKGSSSGGFVKTFETENFKLPLISTILITKK